MKSLKIALLGYGKMGKEIEKAALGRNHSIIAIIDKEQDWRKEESRLAQADAAIDFSTPSAAPGNIGRCFDLHIPIVVGTTGWDKEMPAIRERCLAEGQSLFTASNFSIGVYIFMAAARFLSTKMATQTAYRARIEEIHHVHKLDKPSGTAITLARNVLECDSRYKDWRLAEGNANPSHEGRQPVPGQAGRIPLPGTADGILPILSLREGETVGTHRLFFESDIDSIELAHTAKSRRGFAWGAVMAAEWLPGKTGCFGMQDLLGY